MRWVGPIQYIARHSTPTRPHCLICLRLICTINNVPKQFFFENMTIDMNLTVKKKSKLVYAAYDVYRRGRVTTMMGVLYCTVWDNL